MKQLKQFQPMKFSLRGNGPLAYGKTLSLLLDQMRFDQAHFQKVAQNTTHNSSGMINFNL